MLGGVTVTVAVRMPDAVTVAAAGGPGGVASQVVGVTVVPVTLTRPVERTVTALVDINGRTATCPVFVGPVPPGADCRGRTALPVVFAPGQTDATVGVRIYADTNAELDELLEVTVNAVQTDGPTTAPVGRVHTQGIVTLQTDD